VNAEPCSASVAVPSESGGRDITFEQRMAAIYYLLMILVSGFLEIPRRTTWRRSGVQQVWWHPRNLGWDVTFEQKTAVICYLFIFFSLVFPRKSPTDHVEADPYSATVVAPSESGAGMLFLSKEWQGL